MKHLALHVKAESPLAIRSDHAPGGAGRAKYIPGSTLIGGLTMFYRLLYEGDERTMQQFAPLFLNERVLYPNLYPAIFDDSEGLQERNLLPVYPIPQTAQSCKRHSGFIFPATDKNDGHGARDTLIDWGLFNLAKSDPIKAIEILQEGKNCQHPLHGKAVCDETMDHLDGYYRRSDIHPYHMIEALPDSYTRLRTHTGIDRESGTVQDGILYNRQVFDDGMQFWGEVLFPDEKSDDEKLFTSLETFIEELNARRLLHLGTGRSRGMGKVSLAIDTIEYEQDRFTAFSRRLNAFDETFRKRARRFQRPIPENHYFFAITLHSPLILCNDLLQYQGTIDKGSLQEALSGYTIPELERLYYAASIRRVTGWQELWGTPRAAEYAIESGSAFLFSCSSPLNDTLHKALFALEEQGMGKRRAEGFGRICISDPFHLLVQQEGIQV